MVERHALRHLARQRLGARRPRRPRAVALLLAHPGQHADRQPRRRHLERLPVTSSRPTTSSSRSTRRPARSAGTRSIADFNQQYFSTMAPIVIDNHVIVGTGNDLDSPGYLQSFDPDTGEVQWRFYTVPMKAGDPGLDTWPNLHAARYGGGHPWLPGVYDPETSLYIFGTGNPIPAYTAGRGEGDNLFTCSLIAVHVDTGKMAWYFQTSPHDMHDWDSAQTPILFDATIKGKPRKLVSTAARNGYFFTLDRVTGEHIVTTKYGSGDQLGEDRSTRRARCGATRSRTRRPRRARLADLGRHDQLGAAGLLAGHRAVLRLRAQRLLDLLPDRSRSARLDGPGRQGRSVGRLDGQLPHGDRPATGKIAWRRPYPGGWRRRRRRPADDRRQAGVRGRRRRQPRRLRRGDRQPLWHSRIGNVTNPPMTYMLDGRQHILVGGGRHAVRVRAVRVATVAGHGRRRGRAAAAIARWRSRPAHAPARSRRRGPRRPRRRRRHRCLRLERDGRTPSRSSMPVTGAVERVDRRRQAAARPQAVARRHAAVRRAVGIADRAARRGRVDAAARRIARPTASASSTSRRRTLVRTYPSGQDPESFDLSPDGKTLYVSNEETAEMSVLDLRARHDHRARAGGRRARRRDGLARRPRRLRHLRGRGRRGGRRCPSLTRAPAHVHRGAPALDRRRRRTGARSSSPARTRHPSRSWMSRPARREARSS